MGRGLKPLKKRLGRGQLMRRWRKMMNQRNDKHCDYLDDQASIRLERQFDGKEAEAQVS